MKRKWKAGEDRNTYTDEWWEALIRRYFPDAVFTNTLLPYDVCRIATIKGQNLFYSNDDGSYSVAVEVDEEYKSVRNKQKYIEMLVDFVVEYHEKECLNKNLMFKDLARYILNSPLYNMRNYFIKDISMPIAKAITITAQSIDNPDDERQIHLQ